LIAAFLVYCIPDRWREAAATIDGGLTPKHAMDRRRGIARALGCSCQGARRRPDAGGSKRISGLVGWLAVAALLLHGWLPIVIQVHLIAPGADGHGHPGNAIAAVAPPAVPSGEGPECPLFHSAICLCATFVKLLPAPGAPASGAAFAARDRRSRFPARRPSRPRPALPFDARAPPASS
jgi:hypothetical protein